MHCSLRTKILSIIVGVVLLTTVTFMFFAQREIKKAMTHAERESAKNALHMALLNVENEYEGYRLYKEAMLEKYKQQLVHLNEVMWAQIDEFYDRSKRGLISTESAQRLARESVRKLRYGNNNYFFIVDKDFKVIAHPDPEMQNQNTLDLEDGNGNNLGHLLVDTALKQGKGFTEYSWQKLGENRPQKKLAHVSYYPKWNWVIGTGVYMDDIERESQDRYEVMLDALQETFSKITISKSGYLFLFDGNKKMLIHPNMSGADTAHFKNPSTGNSLTDELIAASQNPDAPLEYRWDKPSDKGNYKFWKESYVIHFKPLDWYLSSSVYKDEINAPAIALYKKIFYASLVLFVIAAALSIHFAKSLTTPITKLVETMRHIAHSGLSPVEVPIGGTGEIRELGNIFKRMLHSIHNAAEEKEEYEKKVRENIKMAAIGKTASMLLHDVRKPFANIKCLLNMFDFYKDNPSELAHVRREIERSIKGVDTMIAGVTDLSRDAQIETKASPLVALLQHSIIQAAHSYEKYDISFRYDIQNAHQPLVDDGRMIRAVSNIITNALEAVTLIGKRSEGTIGISSKDKVKGDARYVKLTIENDGPALSDEDLANIFKPFYSRGKKHGTGLGLASSHKIVSMHRGDISAKNRSKGRGVKFTILIPASDEPERHDPAPLPAGTAYIMQARRSPDGTKQKKTVSLFIVDDMKINRDHMLNTAQDALSNCDVDVRAFDNPESALEQYRACRPDIIISDYDFGRDAKQTGDHFLKEVRAMDSDVLLFLASNLTASHLEKKAAEAGATGCFSPSITAEELRLLLAYHMRINL